MADLDWIPRRNPVASEWLCCVEGNYVEAAEKSGSLETPAMGRNVAHCLDF
jgi:hypothetical protein